MKRKILIFVFLIGVFIVGNIHGSFKNKRDVILFGYGFGAGAHKPTWDEINKRFGKTGTIDCYGHGNSPVYISKDKRSILAFGWCDSGLEQMVIAEKNHTDCEEFVSENKMTVLKVKTSSLTSSTGTALGDTMKQVERRNGKPDIKEKSRKVVKWHYVRDMATINKENIPTCELLIVFLKGRVIRMELNNPCEL